MKTFIGISKTLRRLVVPAGQASKKYYRNLVFITLGLCERGETLER
jgi:hypothetical protein